MKLTRQSHTRLFNRRSLGYLMMGIAAAHGAHAQTADSSASKAQVNATARASADASIDSRSIVDVLQANRDSLVRTSRATATEIQGNVETFSASSVASAATTPDSLDAQASVNSATELTAVVESNEGVSVNLDAASDSVNTVALEAGTDLVQATQQNLGDVTEDSAAAVEHGAETLVTSLSDGVMEAGSTLDDAVDVHSGIHLNGEVLATEAISSHTDKQTRTVLEGGVENALELNGVADL